MGVPITNFSLPALEEFVREAKYLTNLDLSWCNLLPRQMRKLLAILRENRKLQYLNLAWNNICDSRMTVKEQAEVLGCIGD